MLNLVVSLVAESRPLIRHFGLREQRTARGFRVYHGDGMRLVVSGIGKTAAGAGAAYLGALAGAGQHEAWLNVGIAGHAELELGEPVHALRITDVATGRNWYPPQILDLPGRGLRVLTVDRAETLYADDAVYDMEAAAFYATALRFSVPTHVAERNRVVPGAAISVSLLADGIHLLPYEAERGDDSAAPTDRRAQKTETPNGVDAASARVLPRHRT